MYNARPIDLKFAVSSELYRNIFTCLKQGHACRFLICNLNHNLRAFVFTLFTCFRVNIDVMRTARISCLFFVLIAAVAGHAQSLRDVGVADGDTITALDESKRQIKVKLAGVNALDRVRITKSIHLEHML